jgi:hypothetical protein
MGHAAIALIIGSIGLAACQNSAPPRQETTSVAPVDHAAEARTALAARNWSAAASHFRSAIAADPKNVMLHFGLATSASWLGLTDEATTEFRWVVAHAPTGSAESRTAKEWLSGAAAVKEPEPAADDASAPGSKIGDAGIHGMVTWEGPGHSYDVLRRAQLHLRGLPDGPAKGMSYYVRTDKEGSYRFSRIKAGTYRLTDAIAGTPKWNLKVEVKSGEDLEFDLSNGNSRNDFPSAEPPTDKAAAPATMASHK